MANAVFPLYKQSVIREGDTGNGLDGTTTSAPYVSLVDTGTYTYNATHQFYSSLTGIVGTDQPITTPTTTNGTFDGDDVTFTAVSGASVEALVIYRHNTGANTTWRLVLYEDTSVTGLPVTPNGGNIVVTWNASGIFTISSRLYKENIQKLGQFGPAEIVSYSYLGENKQQIGLIAEQVETFAPHAVREFHGVKHVDYVAAFEAALAA